MKIMLASETLQRVMVHLVAMGFENIEVTFDYKKRAIRATCAERKEAFTISPIDSNPAHENYYWGESGWRIDRFYGLGWVESKSSEDWSILDACREIDECEMA